MGGGDADMTRVRACGAQLRQRLASIDWPSRFELETDRVIDRYSLFLSS